MVNTRRGAGARKELPATSGGSKRGRGGNVGRQAEEAVPEVQAAGVDLGAQLVQLLTTRLNEMEGRLRTDMQTQINEVRAMAVGTQGQVPVVPPVERIANVDVGVGGGVPPTNWLRILKQFGDLKPKAFTGESDGISAESWKKDIRRKVLQMDVDSVQRQRLASFYLEGAAGKWWDGIWSEDKKLNATWEEFEVIFDNQFISDSERTIRRAELMKLQQGEMTVDEYENKFHSLLAFADGVTLSEAAMASQFLEGLNPKYKGQLRVQRLKTLRDVVDSARMAEVNSLEAQKAREGKAKDKENEKAKGKRPTGDGVAKGNNGGDQKKPKFNNNGGGGKGFQKKPWFDKDACYNCGEKGHIRSNCTKPAQAWQGANGGGQGGGNRQGQVGNARQGNQNQNRG